MRHGRATRDVRYSLSSSHRGRWMRRTIAATAGILMSAGLLGRPALLAQANPYPVDLLPALRRGALARRPPDRGAGRLAEPVLDRDVVHDRGWITGEGACGESRLPDPISA